jgi:hypothetical protein
LCQISTTSSKRREIARKYVFLCKIASKQAVFSEFYTTGLQFNFSSAELNSVHSEAKSYLKIHFFAARPSLGMR